MTCEHPEDQLQPLAFNGVIDVEEWECAACGHWSVKEPTPPLMGIADGELFVDGSVLVGTVKSASWVPVSSEALEDMSSALSAFSEVSISMSMSMKDCEDAFANIRDSLSKQSFMITNAGSYLAKP